MYQQNLNSLNIIEDLGERVRKRSVYLEGGQPFYKHSQENPIAKVAPGVPAKAFQDPKELNSVLYDTLKPILYLMKIVGLLPITNSGPIFYVTPHSLAYSIGIFMIIFAYIGYIRWDKVEMVRSAEGRFEEAVIDYLFTIYLVPIIINPISWYEARKQARVLTNIIAFERIYYKLTKKKFINFLGTKPLMISIGLPVLALATMVVTHVTMVHFKFLQVVPYCYINMISYLLGGSWYIYCDLIGRTAIIVADDFQEALKNIGPSSRVADYRSLWMMLSRIIRDVGNAFGYAMTFLCLYLFLIITLTIYGLLSQIQEGFGVKDIGLTITAFFAGAILFFISDEAHYASNCISMFLRATEMNPTDMTLVGFFVVNRNLFKSLIATMVTYLVVLLQFQISIPEDGSHEIHNSTRS